MTCKDLLISGDRNGFIKVWNTTTAQCLNSYKCHECLVVDMIIVDRLDKKSTNHLN